MNKKTAIITGVGVGAALLLAVGVWWLFNSGRLVYVASPDQSTNTSAVCDNTIVDTYNDVSYYALRGDDTMPTFDKEGTDKLVADIKSSEGYELDATCQTILFFASVRNSSYAGAKEAYEALLDLHKKGVYANSNIRSNEPLFKYPDFFNILPGAPAQED